VKENSLKALPEPLATYNGGSVNALSAMRVWRNDILPEQNFNALAKEELFKAESRRLAQSDETYKYTLQEYKDGFMVFEINQRYIWQDTKEDTTALVMLYEQNKARYSKGGTFEGDIYFFKTKKDRKKAKHNPALAAKLAYKVVSGKQEQGGLYDDLIWSLGEHDYVIVTGKRTDGEMQTYEKVKGRLIADYHQQKEKEYVMQLRKRFNPKVVGKIK
jgi:peptidyl-prolyl cis-trans isomerase SurA